MANGGGAMPGGGAGQARLFHLVLLDADEPVVAARN